MHGKQIPSSWHPGKPCRRPETLSEGRKGRRPRERSGAEAEGRKERPEGARRVAEREKGRGDPEWCCNQGGAGGKARNPRAPARAQGAGRACPTPGRL